MSVVEQMLTTHPDRRDAGVEEKLRACIEACGACAQACALCADACMSERDAADLLRCVRADLDCADLCETTQRVLCRRTEGEDALVRALVKACAEACRMCGEECERHAPTHEHCWVCAEACRRCESACRELLAAL
ncbi:MULTISPECIES: four-helix bundle copper-binding protein [unclassified Nocardiopsis]|uniref:four-helix bundle copper-binding protein n=1 Tax=unclassified Nocardiopsis TaxID=2649073 RepID=UPI001357DD9A|nr:MULTISPECIES: four-helix bundle copper-binding protein [unclassified Nocardiopsis]